MTGYGRALALVIAGMCFVPASALAQARRPPLRPPQAPPTPAHPTFAPSAEGRRFVTFGGSFGLPANFRAGIQPLDFAERANVDTTYSPAVLPGFDVGGGQTVWRRLAIAADVERVSKSGSGDVSARIPHPFFFSRLRDVSGNVSTLQRTETAIHVQGRWTIPLTPRIDLGVGGGPSWIWLRQDLVRDVTVAQTYPFDSATFSGVITQRDTKGRVGVNAGMTLDYQFTPRLGVEAGARYAYARIRFDAPDTGTIAVDAGGGRIGAGLRLRF